MTTFITLLNREVKSFFCTPIAYVVMFFYLSVCGFNFFTTVQWLSRGPSEVTVLELFFVNLLFWFGYILAIPLITMRSFCDEFKTGTLESLTTVPVTDWQIILSKFFGVVLFYVVLHIPTGIFFVVLAKLNMSDSVAALGAFQSTALLLLFMGMFYISIGCLASAMVREQVNAGVIAIAVIILYFFASLFLPYLFPNNTSPALQSLTRYFSSVEHMQDFSKGVVDTRPLLWYASGTAAILFLTHQVFQYRKWRA
jgi:ABC-2 type transport system permease protein